MKKLTGFLPLTLACVASIAHAEESLPLRTGYAVLVHTESWMPIREKDLRAALEQTIAAQLSSTQQLSLFKATVDPSSHRIFLKNAVAILEVHADIIGEAGTLSLSLLLRPNGNHDVSSASAAATTTIRRMSKSKMLQHILRAATEASQQLKRAITWYQQRSPVLGNAAAHRAVFQWGKLNIPRLRGSSADMRIFLRTSGRTDKRLAAGARLSGRAYDDARVRHAFERAALTDPNPKIRCMSLNFLEAAARKYPLTKRVILEVARRDAHPTVRFAAFLMSRSFVSQLPTETFQTWAELLTASSAEFPSFQHLGAWVEDFGSRIPNLEAALFACLIREDPLVTQGDQRKRDCLRTAHKALSDEQLFKMLMTYLSHPKRDRTFVPIVRREVLKLRIAFSRPKAFVCRNGVCERKSAWSESNRRRLFRYAWNGLLSGDTKFVGERRGNSTRYGPASSLLRGLSAFQLEALLGDRDVTRLLVVVDQGRPVARDLAKRMLSRLVGQSRPPWGGTLVQRNYRKIADALRRWQHSEDRRSPFRHLRASLKLQGSPWRSRLRHALTQGSKAMANLVPYFGEMITRTAEEKHRQAYDAMEALRWIGSRYEGLRRRCIDTLTGVGQSLKKRGTGRGSRLIAGWIRQILPKMKRVGREEKRTRRRFGRYVPRRRRGFYWMTMRPDSPRLCRIKGR